MDKQLEEFISNWRKLSKWNKFLVSVRLRILFASQKFDSMIIKLKKKFPMDKRSPQG